MSVDAFPALNGVIPVLPTPFHADGMVDEASLRRLVRYLLRCGVDGMTYPGVASEFAELSLTERVQLTLAVLDEVGGQVPVVVGGTAAGWDATRELLDALGSLRGASALMVADRPQLPVDGQIAFFRQVAAHVDLPLMLQNVPAPVGAGLSSADVLAVVREVPQITFVKEETLPSGQRLTQVLEQAPASLRGVLGGAGGRYITDEIRRGACGTMPAIELAEVHVALWAAHRQGDEALVRALFSRMMPILNIQAVFRWSLTKHVLWRRGLIGSPRQRAAGPLIDTLDAADVEAFMADLADLLLPASALGL